MQAPQPNPKAAPETAPMEVDAPVHPWAERQPNHLPEPMTIPWMGG